MAKNQVQYLNIQKIHSVREMMEQAQEQASDMIAYRYKNGNEITDITYSQFNSMVSNLGAFLNSVGADKTHIACIGPNSFDWLLTYFTVLRSAGVFVPVDKELPIDNILNILNESDAEVLFCTDKYEQMLREKGVPERIRYIINFERTEDDGIFLSFSNCISNGANLSPDGFLNYEKSTKELKMIVFTSGTTGVAKGVMLSEKNIISDVYYGMQVAKIYGSCLSILPYHHTYEAVADILTAYHNRTTLCINDSMLNTVKNLQVYKPEYMFIVPAVAEMFYSRIMRSLRKDGKDKDFEKLVVKSNAARKFGIDIRPEVFAQMREIFGGNLKKIVCGGAAIRPTVAKFYDDIGIDFINGYGITECSPLVSVNSDSDIDIRTAGIKLPCIDIQISFPNEEGIGEICVKGPTVMMGYYKRPDLTAEAMHDGWFYTGDYGFTNDDNHLIICGRKKNVIVLSNGKNIYPEEIEGYIQDIDYVSEVVVSSDCDECGNENSLTAEVFLSEIKTSSEVMKNIKRVCKDLPVYKQISKVVIRDKEFDKTTTNKIKRFPGSKRRQEENAGKSEDK